MSNAAQTTYLLPPAAYHEQAWFDAEREQLFEHTWVFAGVEHDLQNPGDFVTAQVGRSPVVVVRDGDGLGRVLQARGGDRIELPQQSVGGHVEDTRVGSLLDAQNREVHARRRDSGSVG